MFSEADKLACVEREMKYRERVYARLVESGKMSEQLRLRELALMKEIVEDYKTRAAMDRLL